MDKTRRNFMLTTAAVLASAFGWVSAANKKSSPNSNARLGINLSSIVDWGTEFPFVDLFKQSRAWSLESKDSASSSQIKAGLINASLILDAQGWISHLPLGITASAIISSLDNGHFPSGDYVILYDGEGEIAIPNYLNKSAKPGRIVVNVNGKKGLFHLIISKIHPTDYIKNIRVIPAQFEHTYQKNPWHPAFLARWQGVANIRFMDFMTTNNSTQVNWSDRPQLADASYVPKGVPLELMVDLANRLNTEPWFCLPHMANDDYNKQFASTVKAYLNPNLHAWVEYSNEVWNGGFNQNVYAAKEGLRLKLALQPWEAALKYNAYRSMQIFKIWGDVFGQNSDNQHKYFVRVLASQAAYTGVAEQILSFKLDAKQAANQADVLAIAPYINFSVPPNADDGITDKIVANWSMNQLFDHLNQVVMPTTIQWIKSHQKLADDYQLKVVAYEAGQHLVGVAGAENNEQLTQLFLKANADARMGELYTQYLSAWTKNGGDLICAFNSVGVWSKWGSWGLLQYNDDKPSSKFKAVIDWANLRGQKMRF